MSLSETNQGANPSHAVLVAEVARLRESNQLLRNRLEQVLEVAKFIGDDTGHQIRSIKSVLEATKL